MLIGLCGFKRSGKDTFAAALVRDCGFHRLAFADRIKQELLSEGFPPPADDAKEVPGEDGRSYRDRVIERGESRRAVDPQHWIKRLAEDHAKLPSGASVVISDCRRPNEMDWVRNHGGVLIWIAREGVVSNGHDTELDHRHRCHGVIDNEGPAPSGHAIAAFARGLRDVEALILSKGETE